MNSRKRVQRLNSSRTCCTTDAVAGQLVAPLCSVSPPRLHRPTAYQRVARQPGQTHSSAWLCSTPTRSPVFGQVLPWRRQLRYRLTVYSCLPIVDKTIVNTSQQSLARHVLPESLRAVTGPTMPAYIEHTLRNYNQRALSMHSSPSNASATRPAGGAVCGPNSNTHLCNRHSLLLTPTSHRLNRHQQGPIVGIAATAPS